ncbi:hypothetical protein KAR28_05585 [Candidatus Parcubacteria bacterium]|nr:hypothetical protein [Candidatus Parcubacteria bacterium]
MSTPEWLPEIIPFSNFNSDLDQYLDHLHNIFKRDFIDSRLHYNSKPVIFDNREINNYPACFWHLITEDKIKDYSRIDIENISLLRCERVCWIKPMIENHTHEVVSVWENTRYNRGKKSNTVFFMEDYDYVVILTNIKNRFYLVTAYFVNYPYRKEQLIQERDKYYEMQKPPPNGTV